MVCTAPNGSQQRSTTLYGTGEPGQEAEQHEPVTRGLLELIRRGQRTGEFDRRASPAWLVAATIALGHAAGAQVAAGHMSGHLAGAAFRDSVLRVYGVDASAPPGVPGCDDDGQPDRCGGGVTAVVIAASGLCKRYGPVSAVDGVDLRVGVGDVYALLGLNGAGKTTTIRMLLGMVRPSAGSVALWDTRVGTARSALWARVGYLVEAPAAYPELTVRENLELVRRLRRVPDRAATDHVIDLLGLGRYAHRRAGTLSQGNAQRLGLAKAFIHRPRLLVLDEPANGLDPEGVVEVRHLLRALAADGVTVFLSSHILTEVARLATRIGILHDGRLLQELDARVLARRARRRLAVAAHDNQAARAALAAAGYTAEPDGHGGLLVADDRAVAHPEAVATLLVGAGCPPTRLLVAAEDLEDYFLRLVGAVPVARGDRDG